jgi:hypothetical protein
MERAVKKRAAVWAAWATCLLVAALTVAAVVIDFLPGQSQRLSLRIQDWSFTAVAVPFAAVGALIAVHRPGNRLGVLLLVGALATSIEKVAQELVHYGVRRPGSVPALEWIAWVSNWAWVPAILMLLLLPVLFPDGQPLSPRWRPLLWAIVAGALVSIVGSALIPGIVDAPSLRNPLGLPGTAGAMLEQGLSKLFLLGLPVAAVAAAASLIVRFRRARGVERQQLKWLAYAGGVLMIAPAIQDSWLGGWALAAVLLAQLAIPAAIGVAILRYRLYDIDRLINRTLVYGLLTALLAAVYAGLVLGLGQLFGGLGTEPPSWAVAGATLAVAALFQPVRRRIQALVDRRFNRRKYDAAKTIEAFSVRMRDEVDLDTLSAELLAVVDQTMQPTRVSLWLRPPTTASWGQAMSPSVRGDSGSTLRL